eukprot:TRINITY_DN1675_c0_g1_i1.p2 TRINITY_DN1675_c0_g1~~TRINITY_DN1675_c0_g1_i1.p2  ORF type:complete len:274 (+),score=124.15 TRINITY_DN1675_c0_g1_i1:52-873(+)
MEDNASEIPFFSGEKGWVFQNWKPPKDVLAKEEPGEKGWEIEDWHEDDQKRSHVAFDDIKHSGGKTKYHPGSRGWVSDSWRPPFEETVNKHREKTKGIIKSEDKQYPPFEPLLSVTQGPTTMVVELEIPGVSAKNIAIEIIQESSSHIPIFVADAEISPEYAIVTPENRRRASFLVVRGYKPCRWPAQRIYDESGYGLFERKIFLGYNILPSSPVKATYEEGVLTVCVHAKSTVFRRQMIEDVDNEDHPDKKVQAADAPAASSSSSAPAEPTA